MRASTLRTSIAGFLCLAAALVATEGTAVAAAPVVNSVTVAKGQATINWSLPTCVEPRLVETAVNAPSTDKYGYFYPQGNVYSFDVPKNLVTDTSLTPDDPLNGKFNPGTYYAHVGGEDTTQPAPRLRQFSNVVKFVVNADGSGGDVEGALPAFTAPPCPTKSAGGGGSSTTIVNKVTPFGRLTYSRVQSVRKLFVTVRTSEAETLRAAGSVSVPGAAKVYKFRPVFKGAAANSTVKLRLRLSKKDLRAVRRAVKKRKRLKAKLKVTATNGAGIASAQRAAIRLTP
jgi:hypothetical protein